MAKLTKDKSFETAYKKQFLTIHCRLFALPDDYDGNAGGALFFESKLHTFDPHTES